MTLSKKVTLLVALVALLFCAFSLLIQQRFVMPSFLELERDTAFRNGERALEAIGRELEQIGPSVSDWAYWTDTHEFARGVRPDYIEENFSEGATLEAMSLNYLAIYDTAGEALHARAQDLDNSTELSLGELSAARLPDSHPLLLHAGAIDTALEGIVDTAAGPMLVSARPILTNDRRGPIAGTFVMGRLLDEAAVRRLAEQTRLALRIVPARTEGVGEAAPLGGGLRAGRIALDEDTERWRASATLYDLEGEALLDIVVDTPRDISARGRAAVRLSLLSLAAMGAVTMLILMISLRSILLRPLRRLTEHATQIGEGEHLERRPTLDTDRDDEIGVLARTFDDMLERLAEAQKELVTRSYRSGVTEAASGVLHNIGNAITPLNVRLSMLRQELSAAPTAEIVQAVKELTDPATPTERAADLRHFLELAALETATLIRRTEEALNVASERLVDVEQILGDQHRSSRSTRVMEPVDMAALIDSAAAGLAPRMQQAMRIEIAPEVAGLGAVHGTRAALLQVVTNLLVNAAESIISTGSELGRLEVTATLEERSGSAFMHLAFVDNGEGIEEAQLARVFERGFSTKDREGSGQGLHWSANTVRDLGGSLTIESAGAGRGCRVNLALPLHAPDARSATGTGG